MKNLVMILIAGLMIMPVFAQDEKKPKKTPEQKMELKLERMSKHLELSDSQKASLKGVMSKRMEEHKTLQEKHKAIHNEIDAYHAKSMELVRAELTKDQLVKFDEIAKKKELRKAEHKEKVKAFKKQLREEEKAKNKTDLKE